MALKTGPGFQNDLPPLPRRIRKREADVTPRVLEWFRSQSITCAFEIKATDKSGIPASALQAHQRAALMLASTGTLAHKISDAGRVRVPFDGFALSCVPAYVVACFLRERVALVFSVEQWHGANVTRSIPLYRFKL